MRLLSSCPRVACAGGHRAALTIEQSLHGGVGNAWHPGRVPCPKTLKMAFVAAAAARHTLLLVLHVSHHSQTAPSCFARPYQIDQKKKKKTGVSRSSNSYNFFHAFFSICPDRTEAKRLNRVYTSQSDYVYTKIWILNKHPCGRGTGRQAKRSRDWIHPNLSIFRCMCQAPSPGKGRRKNQGPWLPSGSLAPVCEPLTDKTKRQRRGIYLAVFEDFFGGYHEDKKKRERRPLPFFFFLSLRPAIRAGAGHTIGISIFFPLLQGSWTPGKKT